MSSNATAGRECQCEDFAIVGRYAYVAAGTCGLQIIDFSTPGAPTLVGSVDTPGYAYGFVVSGRYAYVADGESGMHVLDVTNPQSPQIAGSVDTPGVASGVAVSGSYAHVADADSGLQVIDVSNPASPSLVGNVDTPGVASAVAVSGSYAHVADADSGLQVIEISNPASPRLVGSADTPGYATDVAVSGSYAYVADSQEGLLVIDVSNPASPDLVGSVDTQGVASAVAVCGSSAYVADSQEGLLVIDVSNPASPSLVGSVGTPYGAIDVAVACPSVWFLDTRCGLHVVRVSVLVADLSAVLHEHGILLRWRALRADFSAFSVLRAGGADPQSGPFEQLGSGVRAGSGDVWEYLDNTAQPGETYAYRIEGQLSDSTTMVFGPVVASRSPRTDFALGRVRPLPAREWAVVSFSMPRREAVRLEIYDVSGRRVRLLLAEVRGPGEHLVTWDGRDDGGQRAASGLYLVQLGWQGGSRTTRAALVR